MIVSKAIVVLFSLTIFGQTSYLNHLIFKQTTVSITEFLLKSSFETVPDTQDFYAVNNAYRFSSKRMHFQQDKASNKSTCFRVIPL
jgi:hypothetical protein